MQVVAPTVRAIMYTWGPGRYTSEGEQMPFRMESMLIQYPTDFMLMLPVIVEHTIDERSPLYGHTHDSLTVRPLNKLQESQFGAASSCICHIESGRISDITTGPSAMHAHFRRHVMLICHIHI